MTLTTAFTRMTGARHPIALAPMGGTAGGALAAAVARGGGLGLLGAGGGEREWLARELPLAAAGPGPWGAGFLTWATGTAAVEHVLSFRPGAVMFSFGDPTPFTSLVHTAGAVLMIQVTGLDEARRARDLGAAIIVAQGTESGGHGARHGRSTLPFVPAVVDLVAPVPVLAAGGIADGRGVAAALALGAAGALLGTRFQATRESLADPSAVAAIIAGRAEDTERSRILDIARDSPWPSAYTARTLGHPLLDHWRDREAALTADPHAKQSYRDAVDRGELPAQPIWAGESTDLITDHPSAADLVESLAAQAETALRQAAPQPDGPPAKAGREPTQGTDDPAPA
ncbi:NAD(P)H-dependent flavin oxidoreductase [Winogradskya humida]|nr:nitronate monooxygenase [Actinoplanes humidus]